MTACHSLSSSSVGSPFGWLPAAMSSPMSSSASLLHPKAHSNGCVAGLGVRLVLVVGCRQQVNELLEEQGVHAQHACGYRVTDAVAMQAVVQAAGSSRMEVEARLSKVRSEAPRCAEAMQGRHATGGGGSWQQPHGGKKPTSAEWEESAIQVVTPWAQRGTTFTQHLPETDSAACTLPG